MADESEREQERIIGVILALRPDLKFEQVAPALRYLWSRYSTATSQEGTAMIQRLLPDPPAPSDPTTMFQAKLEINTRTSEKLLEQLQTIEPRLKYTIYTVILGAVAIAISLGVGAVRLWDLIKG